MSSQYLQKLAKHRERAWRFLLKSALLESQSSLIDHRRLAISKLLPLPFENGGKLAYLQVMATELEFSGVLTFSPISKFIKETDMKNQLFLLPLFAALVVPTTTFSLPVIHQVAKRVEKGIEDSGKGVAKAAKHTGQATATETKKATKETAKEGKAVGKKVGRGLEASGKGIAKGTTKMGEEIAKGAEKAGQATVRGIEKIGKIA